MAFSYFRFQVLIGSMMLYQITYPEVAKSQSLDGAETTAGMCGVVIASEMYAERLSYNPAILEIETPYWVVETDKGAYAAIIGYIEEENGQRVIENLKRDEAIPQDSFCMSFDVVVRVNGMGSAEPIEKITEVPSLSEQGSSHVAEAWYVGETLEWEATIGQWINAADDVRLRTAAYYINGLIKSDDLLRSMLANGQYLELSKRSVECANQISFFALNSGQKAATDRISDIVVVCASMGN